MAVKITQRIVGAAEPAGKNDYYVFDSELKGFGLKITSGGAKAYIVQYRMGTGRQAQKRRIVIGKHGSPWTPVTARAEAKRLLGLVASGKDPAEKRAADRAVITFAKLCDLYLAEGVAHKKASTLKADLGRIEHHLKPLLGSKRIDAITRADIERLLQDVKAGKTASVKPKKGERKPGSIATGGSGAAAQCVTLASTIFNFAVDRGMREENPAQRVKKPPVRKMQRFLSERETAALGAALALEAEVTGNPYASAAVRLLLLTGCRRSEIALLQWRYVDLERRYLNLPDSKTGAKVVPLNAPAIEVLQNLPRVKGNPYVIVGSRDGSPLVGLDKVWVRVRVRAGLEGLRLHDLRHSHATFAAAGGASLPMIGAILGHRNVATTQRYAHLSDDPIRAASEATGARIAAAFESATVTAAALEPMSMVPSKRQRGGRNSRANE